ncbi:MAG: methylmalonyl-CoA epimerase [Caldilineaceae bacterium]|nr:methylmalonyl-CoA epimerase [Caldilineaceae bacterium]
MNIPDPIQLTNAQIDHVGIVVHSLDDALATYCGILGFRLLERLDAPAHGVEIAFLDAGPGTLELLSPTDDQSGTARFLARRGEGTHHVCLAVTDIDQALQDLRARGVRLIDETPRRGIHGLVAFVHPQAAHGVMIELLQKDEAHRPE